MSGTLWILSAPSGAGKTSLVNGVLERVKDIAVSISHTTRAPRPQEKNAVHYHFVSEDAFNVLRDQSGFLEWARVFDHQYGTSREWVEKTLANNIDVILEIDWQGASQVRAQFPSACSVFILPPSIEALGERLTSRGQDNEVVIARRLEEARKEMQQAGEYDYWVINDVFEVALSQLVSILVAHRQLRHKMRERYPSYDI